MFVKSWMVDVQSVIRKHYLFRYLAAAEAFRGRPDWVCGHVRSQTWTCMCTAGIHVTFGFHIFDTTSALFAELHVAGTLLISILFADSEIADTFAE